MDHETQTIGLTPTGGIVSTTGVAGLPLGGLGYVARKHGLAHDNLRSMDVVTADGERVRASDERNPDLFWGMRGGGGNPGIATSFEFDLHAVGPQILSVSLNSDRSVAQGPRFPLSSRRTLLLKHTYTFNW